MCQQASVFHIYGKLNKSENISGDLKKGYHAPLLQQEEMLSILYFVTSMLVMWMSGKMF